MSIFTHSRTNHISRLRQQGYDREASRVLIHRLRSIAAETFAGASDWFEEAKSHE